MTASCRRTFLPIPLGMRHCSDLHIGIHFTFHVLLAGRAVIVLIALPESDQQVTLVSQGINKTGFKTARDTQSLLTVRMRLTKDICHSPSPTSFRHKRHTELQGRVEIRGAY